VTASVIQFSPTFLVMPDLLTRYQLDLGRHDQPLLLSVEPGVG
jgi:hypothetical protein